MTIRLSVDDVIHEVTITRRRPHLVLRIDGREHEITQLPGTGDGRHVIAIDGHVAGFARAILGDRQDIRFGGRTFEVDRIDPFSREGAGGGGQDALKAPMPGAVVSVHKQAGESVARGEVLVTIESMKLQTALPSPRNGVIADILRTEGQTFEKDEIIVTLEPENEKA